MATDSRMSFAARGLLMFLLSKPDHWEINLVNLISESPLGRDGVRKLLNELMQCGYVKKEQINITGSGRFDNVHWIIYDKPVTDNPAAVKAVDKSPVTEKPSTVKEPQPEIPSAVEPVDKEPVTDDPVAVKPMESKSQTDTADGFTGAGKPVDIVSTEYKKILYLNKFLIYYHEKNSCSY